MPRVNQAQVEEEMRILAEERSRSVAGDAPMLTRSQTAKIWNRSAAWVKAMQDGWARSHRPVRQYAEKVPRAVVIIGFVKGV